ncbi:hypothetical protein [Sodalis sp. (in: enterobacteria)]|uniref:hypothetical protein n=1 Tax=Sodalis sp. (in: enterobacteria) TaxID=1898979 RepID=UPI003F2FF23A
MVWQKCSGIRRSYLDDELNEMLPQRGGDFGICLPNSLGGPTRPHSRHPPIGNGTIAAFRPYWPRIAADARLLLHTITYSWVRLYKKRASPAFNFIARAAACIILENYYPAFYKGYFK